MTNTIQNPESKPKPTPIAIPGESKWLTRIKTWWFSIVVSRKEFWWALMIIVLGLLTWRFLPYLPFVMPQIVSVPVTQTEISGAHKLTVVHPKLIAVGKPFQLSIVYDQTGTLPDDAEELEIRIVPTPIAMRVDPSQIAFPTTKRLPSHLSKDVTILIPIIDPPPEQAALQLTIVTGNSSYEENLELPLVVMPTYLVHLILALSGILSLQSLWILVTRIFKFFQGRVLPEDESKGAK